MPNDGDKIELIIAKDVVNITHYVGIFAGYDTVTENYIIEDCYCPQAPSHKSKMFFNRR